MLRILIGTVLLSSCGLWEKEDNAPKEPTAQECLTKIQFVRDTYVSLLPGIADADGWFETDACDALLWNSLLAAGGVDIDVTKARGSDGKWYRRPAKDCFATGGSKSEISRDMLLGLMFYATYYGRLELLQSIYKYGSTNGWVMGEGDLTRTVFSPSLQATLADAIAYLGGEQDLPESQFPQAWYAFNTGFRAHLDILHILLRGQVVGGISDAMANVLEIQYNRDKNNPLFSYAWHKYNTGDYREALGLLDNEALWPKERLPTSANYCDAWPFQRDPGPDWAPCADGKTYTGGGFILLTRLIEREFEQ